MAEQTSIEQLIDDFSYLEDWEDRYAHVLDLGRALAPLSAEEHNKETLVEGCVSQVWLVREPIEETPDPTLNFRGDSDSLIVRGLIAILLLVFSGRKASEILELDASATFGSLGLDQHLTPQRANGLSAMVRRVKAEAAAARASRNG